jgi:mannose-6-phosphate isomerase-like protein (cupin superfamily)
MIEYKIDFSSVDWESPSEGVRQKATTDGDKIVRLVEYSPNMPLHWCEKGHFGYILEGRFEIDFADSSVVLEQGDGVFIPNGHAHRHRGRALSDVVRVFLVEDV